MRLPSRCPLFKAGEKATLLLATNDALIFAQFAFSLSLSLNFSRI